MTTLGPTCKQCRFYTARLSSISALRPKDGVGECRRNAPRGPVVLGWSVVGKPEDHHSAIMSAFPFVPEDDWCGEFQAGGPTP